MASFRAIILCLTSLLCFTPNAGAYAQSYPTRTIRVVVPFTPGTGIDLTMRTIAHKVEQLMNVRIAVENRPGAGGTVGAKMVKDSAPDGYTLLMGDVGALASNVTLQAPLGYDPEKDFQTITMLYEFPSLLDVIPALGVNSVAELIELAKTKNGGLTYASQGVGSGGHLLGALFSSLIKTPMVHVPYPGAGPMRTDLIAGRVDFMFNNYFSVKGDLDAGTIKALAVTSERRLKVAPSVPTMAEVGLPDLTMENWFGLVGPARIDPGIVKKLNAVFVEALRSSEVSDRLSDQGYTGIPTTPQEFSAKIHSEITRTAELIHLAGASAN